MDEWMHLRGGEAAHRQHEQRALRHATHTAERYNTGRRLRAALATALIALAARLDATAILAQRQDAALTPASPA
jgi:hypothetical protein